MCDVGAMFPQVVDIMRVNVDKVLERDQKLSELDDRADALQAGASQFETSAAKLKRKYWWKNCKVIPFASSLRKVPLHLGVTAHKHWACSNLGGECDSPRKLGLTLNLNPDYTLSYPHSQETATFCG